MTEPDETLRVEPQAIAQAGRLGRWIDRFAIVPALGLILSMAILIQEVVLRYVFGRPTIWAHETTVFLCAVAFLYGGLLCAARDRHIRVVLVYDLLPGHVRRILDVAISVVCALSSAAFAMAAWQMVLRAAWRPDGSFHLERSGSAWDPVYPGVLKILLMLILGLLALQFLVLAVNYARGRR
ncbi:tripartite ATP-independent transporter DctQ subunit [Albidovulum inexpectatum]|uniref:TRAP transporter small permease protein n=1 Tax=Albidovulum inexpectatum TaxID=196587 RepID=A0A2S5JHG0_9RHOB|nr:TRAP transporter small permease [Albidovulum inexpectatum]PPB80849.1 tripartite ATP-independent transporter DctQ subunit [Albidovulum inexpectatum]